MPFITEELWHIFSFKGADGNSSIMVSSWPKSFEADFKNAEDDFEVLQNLVIAIRSFKKDLGLQQRPECFIVPEDARSTQLLKDNAVWISFLARADITMDNNLNLKECVVTAASGFQIAIARNTIGDINTHKTRIEKKIKEVTTFIGNLERKLSNPSFCQRAPEEVIHQTKSTLKDTQIEKARLEKIQW